MKYKLPWILCVLLLLALIVTNLPSSYVANQYMPADFKQFDPDNNHPEIVKWKLIHNNKGLSIYLMPSYGPETCRHAGTYAVTYSNILMVTFGIDGTVISAFRNGNIIANMPVIDIYERSRSFYYYQTNSFEYAYNDLDNDGIIDTKRSRDREWIYNHGTFSEVIFTSRYIKVKQLLDGKRVALNNGQWVPVETK